MSKSLVPFACMTLASLPAAARIDTAADNIAVRIRYQGQRIPGDSYFYFISQAGGVNCGGDRFNVPVGGYTLSEGHGHPRPPVPFTVTAGQTTIVDVETSGHSTFLLNGQPPSPPAFVRTGREDVLAYADTTGRRLALAGLAGTNPPVPLQIDLGTYPTNTRVTVKLDCQGNSEVTTGFRTFYQRIG